MRNEIKTEDWWKKLKTEVINPGLCTQCGSCVGLSQGLLKFSENKKGIPLPRPTNKEETLAKLPKDCYSGCPGRYCNYPQLNQFVFKKLPENWLSGVVNSSYVGHSADEFIRRNGASGGVLSNALIYLLETKKIKGAICLELGKEKPYQAQPILARTREEVLKCAQSVYCLSPINTILDELKDQEGPFAYVGLPDQVASIRKLQQQGHPIAMKIKYIFGPYMGTQMYFESIRSFLRSNKINSEREIASLKYRAGEWPGYLEIKLKNGKVLRAEKFYYNYLIPFFITSNSLQLVDFTNELTDLSVGDAWSPKYEKQKGGHSVILARNEQGEQLLKEMEEKKLLNLEQINLNEALSMHGHMLDFKKRGSFIRNKWKKVQPEYGYKPDKIPSSRYVVEIFLKLIFSSAKTKIGRKIIEILPISIVGPAFNWFRKTWKKMSKPTKRKGLLEVKFKIDS